MSMTTAIQGADRLRDTSPVTPGLWQSLGEQVPVWPGRRDPLGATWSAEATNFARLLRAAAGSSVISAGNVIEANRVMLSRAGGRSVLQLDRFLRHFDLQIAPVDAAQVELARDGIRHLRRYLESILQPEPTTN
jgi:hypothetical protein